MCSRENQLTLMLHCSRMSQGGLVRRDWQQIVNVQLQTLPSIQA